MKSRFSRTCLVGLFLLALWIGLRWQDYLLLWSSLFVLLALTWAAMTVLLTGLVLRRSIAVSTHPRCIEASSEELMMTGWHCQIPRWIPLANFSSSLNGHPTRFVRTGDRLSEWSHFPRRRLQSQLERRFELVDFLGVVSWSFVERRDAPLRVLPTINSSQGITPPIGVVTGADIPNPYAAETGDRLDMRRYRKGDPLRLVLWTIYQRSGYLMVRAPEKAVSQHQRTGLYLLTGPADSPAAKLALRLLEQDALGIGWRFGADGTVPWAEQRETALDVLAESGRPEAEVRIGSFLLDLVQDRFGKCLVLVAPDPPSRNQKLATLAQDSNLPRLGLEIWVVYDPPEIPARNTFPTVAGAEMHLIERSASDFKMVAW